MNKLLNSLPQDAPFKKNDPRIIKGRAACVRHISNEIQDRTRPAVIIVDGLPGSGKSGLTERILASNPKSISLALDYFIGTERGSVERRELTDNISNFRQGYMRYTEAQAAMSKILEKMQGTEAESVTIPSAYLRELGGKFGPYELEVPADSDLLVVEGTGAIPNIEIDSEEVNGISIYVYAQIRQSLLNGTLRDLQNRNGVGNFEEIYAARLKEYQYLINDRESSIYEADKICIRYPNKRTFKQKLGSYGDFGRTTLGKLPNRFLKEISPDGIDLRDWTDK